MVDVIAGRAERKLAQHSPVYIETAQVESLGDVPFQGDSLEPTRFSFKQRPPNVIRLSPAIERTRLLAESFIGVVPYLGEIYDIAQFAYSASTGADFWGATVSDEELVLLGAFVLLPHIGSLGKGAGRAISQIERITEIARGLSRKIAGANVQELLQPALLETIRNRLGFQLRFALENAADRVATDLTKAFAEYTAGRIAFSIFFGQVVILLSEAPQNPIDYTPLNPALLESADGTV